MYIMCSGSGGDSRVAFSENSSPVSERKVMLMKEEGGEDVLTCCQAIHQISFLDTEHLPSWLKPHANKVCLFFVIL